MDKLEQGDRYEEQDIEETGEYESSVDPQKSKTIKMIMAGVIGLLVVGVIVGALIKTNNIKTEEDIPEVEESSISLFSYTGEEVEALRSYGYTGGEIEINEVDCIPAEELINKAKQAINSRLLEQYTELRDNTKIAGSEEYMRLLDDTWLAGPIREVKTASSGVVIPEVKRENVNYKKIAPHGNQLFIKLTLDNGTFLFMVVSPKRYQELPESGNMIITYTEEDWQDETFITSVKEIPLE